MNLKRRNFLKKTLLKQSMLDNGDEAQALLNCISSEWVESKKYDCTLPTACLQSLRPNVNMRDQSGNDI